MIHKDQLGRNINLQKVPQRIVSLVPSQTELLVDMGLSTQLVGVTKFCIHPDTIKKEKTIVGGTKEVHFDRISALNPDIILCNKEENTKEIVEVLQNEFPVHVSDITTIEEALQMIHQYGEIFKKEEESQKIISTIIVARESFRAFIKDKQRKRVGYFIWRNPWMAAGSTTFIDHLLEESGFINVFSDQSRYPEIKEKELCLLQELDVVFLSSEPFPFSEKHVTEIKAMIPNTEVLLVDGEYFSWYGSRLINAFEYFKTLYESQS